MQQNVGSTDEVQSYCQRLIAVLSQVDVLSVYDINCDDIVVIFISSTNIMHTNRGMFNERAVWK